MKIPGVEMESEGLDQGNSSDERIHRREAPVLSCRDAEEGDRIGPDLIVLDEEELFQACLRRWLGLNGKEV